MTGPVETPVWYACYRSCICSMVAAERADVPSHCPTHGNVAIVSPERLMIDLGRRPFGLWTNEQVRALPWPYETEPGR